MAGVAGRGGRGFPIGSLLASGCLVAKYTPKNYVVRPGESRHEPPAYDAWGRSVSAAEARGLLRSEDGKQFLSPANGAVRIDQQFLELGQRTFYEETFDNEIFLTDVLGMLHGPLKPAGMLKALKDLNGEGTTNLRVPLSEDAVIGGVPFAK